MPKTDIRPETNVSITNILDSRGVELTLELRACDGSETYQLDVFHRLYGQPAMEIKATIYPKQDFSPDLILKSATCSAFNLVTLNGSEAIPSGIIGPWMVEFKGESMRNAFESRISSILSHGVHIYRVDLAPFSELDLREFLSFLEFSLSFWSNQNAYFGNLTTYDKEDICFFDRSDKGYRAYWEESDLRPEGGYIDGYVHKLYDLCYKSGERQFVFRILRLYFSSERHRYPKWDDERVMILQTALELATWKICIDIKNLLPIDEFNNLRFESRLHLLLSILSIPNTLAPSYPPSYSQEMLSGSCRTRTGAGAFVNVRNQLIHPVGKQGLKAISEHSEIQTLSVHATKWAQGVVKYAILHLMNFRGRSLDEGELVLPDHKYPFFPFGGEEES